MTADVTGGPSSPLTYPGLSAGLLSGIQATWAALRTIARSVLVSGVAYADSDICRFGLHTPPLNVY